MNNKKALKIMIYLPFLRVIMFLLLCLIIASSTVCSNIDDKVSLPQKNNQPAEIKKISMAKDSTITAYYFHTTRRCYSCTRIEELTRQALDTYFMDEISSGQILFKSVNVERPENRHFIQDYQLFTKTVVLVASSRGKQNNWKRLDKTWEYLKNESDFSNYIKKEVQSLIKEEG